MHAQPQPRSPQDRKGANVVTCARKCCRAACVALLSALVLRVDRGKAEKNRGFGLAQGVLEATRTMPADLAAIRDLKVMTSAAGA